MKGFTLVEVLLSLVIAVVVTTVVAQGMTTGLLSIARADRQVRAVRIAQSRLAEVEIGELSLTRTQVGEEENFKWSVSASSVEPSLHEVTVRVAWPERGTEQSISLVRLIHESQ